MFSISYVNVLVESTSSNIYSPKLEGYKLVLGTQNFPAKEEDMIHVSAPSLSYERDSDLYYGMSPMRPLSRKIRLNNGTQTAAIKLLESGVYVVYLVLILQRSKKMHLNYLKKLLNNLKTDFKRNNQGTNNTGDVMFTSIPLKWQSIGMELVDMQLFEADKMAITSVCNIVGVDPLLMGLKENSSYNNMRVARQDLYLTSAIPFYNKFVEHLNNNLVPMYSDLDGSYLKLDYNEIP